MVRKNLLRQLEILENNLNCQNCQNDYTCCKDYGVTLSKSEINKFEKKKIVPLTENSVLLGFVFILEKKDNGSCVYFDDKTNFCDVYEIRPKACKNFSCIGRV